MNPLIKAIKAFRFLGPHKLWLYARYQLGLKTGHFRRATPSTKSVFSGGVSLPPVKKLPGINARQREQLLEEADQIRAGKVRLFGGNWVPLDLSIGASDKHWTALENMPPEQDIKFIWEPARFGWAVSLARAYAVSKKDFYAQDFWDKTQAFLAAHPPNLGRQWQSAQEVAIRLMVFVFCDRVFAQAPSSTPERRRRLWQAVAEHAGRIPATLVYARAQNNNHLLSEAAGLFTAGIYLGEHPNADKWRQLGWQWFNWGLQNQIDEFGTYMQHSANYHRLMLQLALYTDHLRRLKKETWPSATVARLEAATRWLWALTDTSSGLVPNLGANDSAYIFPLTQCPLEDYRPVVDAAAKAFLGVDIYQQPDLAEMADWFEIPPQGPADQKQPQAPDMLRLKGDKSRAFIQTATFKDRPSHADQLHVDLWWQGVNVALDPGTYLYNGQPPWDNALVTTRVHNTLTVDGHDQMSQAGRFLWLDWAQSEIIAHESNELGQIIRVTAEQDGFRRLGACHQRTLASVEGGWDVEDTLLPIGKPTGKIHRVQLTWLLPDWGWTLDAGNRLKVTGPDFSFKLEIEGVLRISLYRAGELLIEECESEPTWGWLSPAYGVKVPALMVKAQKTGPLPIRLKSLWRFE